jgi:hypothetical protein
MDCSDSEVGSFFLSRYPMSPSSANLQPAPWSDFDKSEPTQTLAARILCIAVSSQDDHPEIHIAQAQMSA